MQANEEAGARAGGGSRGSNPHSVMSIDRIAMGMNAPPRMHELLNDKAGGTRHRSERSVPRLNRLTSRQ